MGWLGRIIGIICGYKLLGVPGAILGVFIGYMFDRGLKRATHEISPEMRAKIETQFFSTLFSLMGYLAKVDGHISTSEVKFTEQLMERLQLTAEHKRQAINLFKQGASADFDLDTCLQAFREVCDSGQMLLSYLVAFVFDENEAFDTTGNHNAEELQALRYIASRLGFSDFFLEQLLRMSRAQNYFYRGEQSYQQQGSNGRGQSQGGQSKTSSFKESPLSLAYQALGVDSKDSDQVIKKAYRKLMSQYHPDKLSGQGVPPDMLKVATEKTQEIQAAYDLIQKSRAK